MPLRPCHLRSRDRSRQSGNLPLHRLPDTLSGSAFRTVVFTRVGTFKLRSGELKIYVKTGESGSQQPQAFCPNGERRSIQPPLRMIPKATPSGSAPSDNAINWCQGHISGFDQLSTGLRRSHPFRRSRSSPHSTELVLCKSVHGTTRTFCNVRYSVAVGCKADMEQATSKISNNGTHPYAVARQF